jgi:hypothetical protein
MQPQQQLRGTQSMVGQMGWVLARPSLTALEVAWRWLIGAPLLVICWIEAQKIIAIVPPENAGLTTISWQNPWTASIKLAEAWVTYQPHIITILEWLAPVAALAWIVVSGIGRSIVLKRMEPRLPLRLFSMILLQAAWLVVLALTGWAWWASLSWAGQTHINAAGEPDLIGYTIWAVFLTLGFFTLWALISWVVTIAPMLVLLENSSVATALVQSLKLGRAFTGKLVEINLVMGIVKIALLVVAMVFSAVLIPFSEEVGASALHLEWLVVTIFYFIASDYFQVVRLKGFIEFWHIYRGPQSH